MIFQALPRATVPKSPHGTLRKARNADFINTTSISGRRQNRSAKQETPNWQAFSVGGQIDATAAMASKGQQVRIRIRRFTREIFLRLAGISRDLSGFDDGAQRVAIIRIAGQRPGVQHKLATRCPGIGGDDGSFHTEFVRRAGLAPADALHLRSVEGIQLPAALALLLRADLIGTREWPGEYRLEVRVACNLAPDVANEPAEAGAQNAQLSTVAVELFGMGITPCHHGGALGDAHIRLPQPHAALPGQSG